MSRPDPSTEVFEAHRPRLTRLAYRMLGSLAEAEDVTQEAWLRWSRVDPAEMRIYRAVVPGEHLLARITDRHEHEYPVEAHHRVEMELEEIERVNPDHL